jgi:arylsulfatase A-like enzyme
MAETHGHKLGCATESFGPERPDFDAQLSAVRRAYADRVHRIDEAIGRIVAALEQRGQLDDTLIIVTSDHGEAFFEHGLYQHDDVPYDEVMRVPLVIHAPGSGAVPGRRARLASHLDLVPTVLARLGETNATAYAGVDLLGPESAPSRSVFSALLMPAQKPQHALRSVLMRGDHKWIEAAEGEAAGELYDLAVDPDERSNLADEAGDLVSSLRSEAALRSSSVRLRPPHHITSGCCVDDPLVDLEGTAISDEQRAQLEALGYGQ